MSFFAPLSSPPSLWQRCLLKGSGTSAELAPRADAAGEGRGGRRPGRGALMEACAPLAAGALVGAVGFVRSICGAVND